MRSTFFFLAFSFLAVQTVHAEEPRTPTKRVLILDSFGRDMEIDAFRAELSRRWTGSLDIYEIPVEAARIGAPEGDKALADFLANRLAGSPLDLVVPFEAPAARFAVKNRDRLFPRTPMLIAATEQRILPPEAFTPMTAFIGRKYNLPQIIDDILRLLPNTKSIAVAHGVSREEQFWHNETLREWASFANRVHFTSIEKLSFEEMKREIATLPPNSAVLFTVLHQDAAGVTLEQHQALQGLRSVSNAPFFSCNESELGLGIIGGRLIPDQTLGIEAAKSAVRLLQGEAPASCTLPPMGFVAPKYDWRELQRWGISESRLPPGSTVLFRPPTLWEQYRRYVVAAVAILSLQTLLIAGLLIHRRRRARVESALVQSQRRLRLIADSLPALIAQVDRDQRYQFVNLAYEHRFGLEPRKVLGCTIREVMGEALYGSIRPYVEQALAGEDVSFTTQFIGQDGQPRVLEATYVPDCDEWGEVRGFYVLALDVTDRNRAQQEARRLLDELAHADRISMMGELAATLAHELNQPMTAIMSNAQAATRFLGRPDPDLEEVREILQEIAEEDARAGEVIRRMRSLVKKERASFHPLHFNEILHEVVCLLRSDALIRKVIIELQLDPDLPAVNGDRIQLQQVVINLLLNAFDAIGENGTQNRTVLVQTCHDDAEIHVVVRDCGAGIAPETLEHLFQPFNTSKPHGLGMGLSISQSIVGLHGGRLCGVNNPGPGATFSFTLPVARVPALELKTERRLSEAAAESLKFSRAAADSRN